MFKIWNFEVFSQLELHTVHWKTSSIPNIHLVSLHLIVCSLLIVLNETRVWLKCFGTFWLRQSSKLRLQASAFIPSVLRSTSLEAAYVYLSCYHDKLETLPLRNWSPTSMTSSSINLALTVATKYAFCWLEKVFYCHFLLHLHFLRTTS